MELEHSQCTTTLWGTQHGYELSLVLTADDEG